MKPWLSSERGFLFASLALLLIMPSTQSLWIDEAFNAEFARMPTFSQFLYVFLGGIQSENQMPLGMFASWLGGRLFGTSEWQLRAINLAWGALGVFSLAGVGRRLNLPWLPLFFAVQPFLWFYMNEARPYAMQIGSAGLLLYALVEFHHRQGQGRAWWIAFCTGALVLCASSLLGVIPFAAMLVFFSLAAWQFRWRPNREQLLALGFLFVSLAALGGFYVWTLLRGATGAVLWKVGPANILLALYDFAGFSGLGPGRSALREGGREGGKAAIQTLGTFALPLIVLALQYLSLAFRRPFASLRAFPMARWIAGVAALSFLMMTGTCLLRGFPFWSRHLAPAFPFFVTAIALGFRGIQPTFPRLPRNLLILLSATLLVSSLQLRFAPRHAKDDYRSATQIALASLHEGKTVWWSADTHAAKYYGLPIAEGEPQTGMAMYLSLPDEKRLASFPHPDLIVTSKPDVFDSGGAMARFIRQHSFQPVLRLPALIVWKTSGGKVDLGALAPLRTFALALPSSRAYRWQVTHSATVDAPSR